jgi:hypothetical protein
MKKTGENRRPENNDSYISFFSGMVLCLQAGKDVNP